MCRNEKGQFIKADVIKADIIKADEETNLDEKIKEAEANLANLKVEREKALDP